jgi:hypothetical protein
MEDAPEFGEPPRNSPPFRLCERPKRSIGEVRAVITAKLRLENGDP